MKKVKKFTAIFLSVLMLFSMVSVSVSAYKSPYLDNAIITQYNTIDKVSLNTEQKATLILDKLDVLLAKEEIAMDLPLIGTIDLTSIDSALNSIYSVTGNWLFGSFTVGDLAVLKTNRGDISTLRRASENTGDLALISSVITYLSHCAPTLVGMIDPSSGFDWGIVKGFLPPELRLITDDFNSWLDEILWEALHPVVSVPMPTDEEITLDYLVQFMCDNQLGGQNAEAMGFDGLMPGFDLDLETADTYRAIEEGIYAALNNFIVPLLNDQLKEVIVNAVESNQNDGGDLYQIVNVNYTIDEYNFTDAGLMEQINAILGHAVNEMLIPLNQRPADTTYTFEWTSDVPEGSTNVEILEQNLKGLLSMIIVAGGETQFDPYEDGVTLEDIGDYIACAAVRQFVKHVDWPEVDEGTMEQVAYMGLRELCASVMPENYTQALPDTATDEQYRAAIIELGADLGAYYLNNNLGLDSALDADSGEFLADFVDWCMPYIEGLFDPSALNGLEAGSDGWDEIDAILWEIIPKDWIPYQTMFADDAGAGIADDLTFESLVNYVLDTIFHFDLNKLNTFFEHNPSSTLDTKNVRKFIIDWVSDILNGAFTPSGKTSCVPENINVFEDLINPISNGTTIICNIIQSLAEDTDLQTTVLNLIVLIMGLDEPQSLGDVHIDIDDRIDCTSGSINSKLRISNFSDGVNSAWKNAEGVIEQDKMYEVELISLTNNAGLTAAVTEGTKIPANGYLDVTITGNVSATTEARFDLSYYILDEDGNRIGSTPLVKSVYTNLYTVTGNYEVTSPESSANNVTFEEFSTYLYTTDVYNTALFSILATNESGLVTSAVDITKAIVTGTLPTGISANAPENDVIVSIDDSSATAASYGTVNPYVSNVDPDAEQPYGIYNVTIQFEVKGTGLFGQETSGTSDARNHVIVVYNDFGLEDLLNDIMNENRQRIDYAADATTEWTNYQNAVSAGFALLQGNPDHDKMFTDVDPDLEGTQNDYYTKVEAIKAAVAALDEKAVTDSAKLAELETALSAYENIDWEDYKLFTYDRFSKAYDRANDIIASQTAPAGEEETFVAPAVKLFDLIYAKNQLALWGGRLVNKPVTTDYLEEELAKVPADSTAYAPDLWDDVQTEVTLANSYIASPGTTTQGKVNANRVNLMEALLALKPGFITVDSSLTLDSNRMLVFAPALTTNLGQLVSAMNSYTVSVEKADASSANYGTGSSITVLSGVNIVAEYEIVVIGDVDGDGIVTIDDYYIIADHVDGYDTSILVNGTPEFYAADANADGVITNEDLVLLGF